MYVKPWLRGAVDIATATVAEDPGSNRARVLGFQEKQSIAVVYN
jgi:hypothetical protein